MQIIDTHNKTEIECFMELVDNTMDVSNQIIDNLKHIIDSQKKIIDSQERVLKIYEECLSDLCDDTGFSVYEYLHSSPNQNMTLEKTSFKFTVPIFSTLGVIIFKAYGKPIEEATKYGKFRDVKRPTYVYVFADGDNFKIGISGQVDQRLKSLRSGSGRLSLIEVKRFGPFEVDMARAIEVCLLRQFGRQGTEWCENIKINEVEDMIKRWLKINKYPPLAD